MRWLLGPIAMVPLLIAATAAASDFYVAPEGDDANPGTADRPFATLTRARDALREIRAGGPAAGPSRINIADGSYTLREPLVLTPRDGGTQAAPVIYQAMPGARPVFSGGRRIEGWRSNGDGLWTTRLPDVAAGRWYFEQLWVNGRRATRARTPNKFYFYIQGVTEEPLKPGSTPSAKKARQTIQMRAEDFRQAFGDGLSPEALRDVNLVVYHKWDNTRRFLDAIDAKGHRLVTSGQAMKPYNPWRHNDRFHLENFREALDAPGEWFLDRDGTLSYRPLPDEDMATASVVAPVVERFIQIQGEPEAGRFVEYLTIRGLSFRHAQYLTPPGGFEPAQAASPIEAVVMADGARNVTIEDCEVGHVGAYGVWFRRGCRDCVLRRSNLHDLGAGGFRIGETVLRPREDDRTSRITIDNSIIRQGGRIFPCAVGVWIGQSPENSVTHNEISDLFYTGISVGWRWGYAESLTKRNTIAYNHVHHIGQGVLSDMGGIYTLGPSEGTVVRNNVFHDIHSYAYGGWGLYTDEGSTGILFENNLVYNTKTGGFHQHYGKENIVRNNILAFGQLQQLQATRVEDHRSFTFERNIVIYDRGELLAGPWNRIRFESGNNCYFQLKGEPVRFLGGSLEDWQAQGHESGSLVADPKLADPLGGDYRISPDSPALTLGFVPFDPSEAGLYGDEDWVRRASEVADPVLEIVPEPPH